MFYYDIIYTLSVLTVQVKPGPSLTMTTMRGCVNQAESAMKRGGML
jgi:hypothetical protein